MLHLFVAGTWITFQVTFTELFIASTVFASVGYKHGWRSAALGAILGTLIITLSGLVLGVSLSSVPLPILDWISALLLLGFGFYLIYEFISGLKPKKDAVVPIAKDLLHLKDGINWAGVSISAWAIMVEGTEVLVVWLAISLKSGMAPATMGIVLGIAVILAFGLFLGQTRIFRTISAPVLDGLAAVMVMTYGIYFFIEAYQHTPTKMK